MRKRVPYNYDLIVGPTHGFMDVMYCLRLIITKYSPLYFKMNNGELHTYMTELKCTLTERVGTSD